MIKPPKEYFDLYHTLFAPNYQMDQQIQESLIQKGFLDNNGVVKKHVVENFISLYKSKSKL